MPSLHSAAALAALLVVCGAFTAAADGTATIYQWTDSEGTTRYTPDLGRVPVGARDTMVTIVEEDPGPGDTPAYFEPDPRADEAPIPDPAGDANAAPPPLDEATQARIRELEAEIAENEEALKEYISDPANAAADRVPPELREIAEQLPKLQAELAALRKPPAASGAP